MKRIITVCVFSAILAVLGLYWAGPGQAAAQQQATMRPGDAQATAEAVVVDIVVRDKKGRTINDLKREEIEVLEDGIAQDVKSFDWIQQEIAFEQEQPAAAAAPKDTPPPITSLRHINLVTMVYDGLGDLDARRLAYQTSEDFLKTGLHKNVLVSVYVIEHRLHIVQPFTNDPKLLHDAVKRATSQTYAQYVENSDSIKKQLQNLTSASGGLDSLAGSIGRDNPSGGSGMGTAAVQAQIAEMTLETLRTTEMLERDQQGRISLYALQGLVRGQQRLAGRKTVLFFSEGLVVPPTLKELFDSIVGSANRNNVSFYAIDARGLTTAGELAGTRSTIGDAARTSRSALSRSGQRTTTSEVRSGETAEASLTTNAQGMLGDLSTSTGGFLIANTNDFRGPMEDIGEDIRGYYEVTYSPKHISYDGKFRTITVNVKRKDVKVQSRTGYFAVPPLASSGPAVQPFETPLLAVLHNPALPKDLDFRSQFLRFGSSAAGTQYVLVMEIPLEKATFEEVVGADGVTRFNVRFGILALFKDDGGQVVDKISQDYPLMGIPADRAQAMRRGNIVFIRQITLMPGRHTVETVVQEEKSTKAGARRTVLVVPPEGTALQMSSLALIRRMDKATPEDTQMKNPLLYGEMKIVPNIGQPIQSGPNARLGIYMVAYPTAGGEAPKLTLELAQNGVALAQAEVPLPAPDTNGRIQYIGELPMADKAPGEYEVRAKLMQGQQTVEEHLLVQVK